MFLGVEYFVDAKPVRIGVDRRDGKLPVATRGGGMRLTPMGRREPFRNGSPGHFMSWPEGNTVSLDMLHQPAGLWQEWRSATAPVKIAVTRFFHLDGLGYRTQRDLAPGQFLQGALLSKPLFDRVYLVVVPAPGTKPGDEVAADCGSPLAGGNSCARSSSAKVINHQGICLPQTPGVCPHDRLLGAFDFRAGSNWREFF